jgi:phosphatidylglycerol:prolipoprotein diacylglycerol transferase
MLDTIFYYPEQVASDPMSLLRLWEGLSSYGGFTGALIGALLWKWRHTTKILPYADVTLASFPVGWLFGRLGCSIVHDHPGAMSEAWFAIRYPGGGRYDLGLYEFLLTIPLVIALSRLTRSARPWGFYIAVVSVTYAPVRFGLDFMRSRDLIGSDPRYGGLTPAQWASIGLFAVGIAFLVKVLRGMARDEPVSPPDLPPRFAESGADAEGGGDHPDR